MAESYSVEAKLSAVDNMSSVFDRVSGSAGSFGNKLKSALGSGLAMGAGMKIINAATSALSNSLDGAISRYDTMKNFPKIMSNLGYSATDAEAAIQKISEKLTGLPTSTDAIVSSAQKLAPLTGSIGKATDVALAMNNALLAGGKSAETQANALEQYSQMLAAGKVDMQAWRSMLDAMPGQLDQLSVSLLGAGHNQADLYEAMKNGEVSFDDFNNAILKLNEEGVDGLASFEEQAKASTQGIATNIQNVKTAITRGMANSITAIDEALEKNKLPSIAELVGIAGDKISDTFKKINGWVSNLDLSQIASVAKSAFKTLGSMASTAGKAVGKAITFITQHAETLSKVAVSIMVVVGAFRAIKTAAAIANAIKALGTSFMELGTKAAGSAIGMETAAAAETTAGTAAKVSAKGFMQAGIGLLAMGAGIALAAGGFWVLTQSALQLASAGAPAIGVIAGMVAAIGGLIALTSLMGAGLTAAVPGLIAFGAAFLAISVGVAIVTLSMSKLASVLPPVIEAASSAITAFGNTIVSVLTTVGGVINSILMTAAMTFTSFGNAVVAVLTSFGGTVSTILTSVGTLFTTFATSVQTVMTGISTVIVSTGEAISGVLNAIAGIFDSIGNAALNAGLGFEHVANGIQKLVAMPLGDLATTLGTTARGLKKIATSGEGMAQVATAMAVVSAGISKISSSGSRAVAAMNKLKVSMASIAASADSTGTAVGSNFASGIASGMSKGASTATSSARRIITSLKSAGSSAQAAGRQAGSGFASGLRSGMQKAVSTSSSMASKITSKLQSAASKMKSVGSNMGAGLAAGLESCASRCERAASRIVAAANKAAAAKAKVHSPSKVWKRIGRFMAEGLNRGLVSKKGATEKTAAKVIRALYGAHKKKISKKKSKELAKEFLGALTTGDGTKGKVSKIGLRWIEAGLGSGMTAGFKSVKASAYTLLNNVQATMQAATKSHDFTGAASKAINAYSSALRKKGSTAIQSSRDIIDATFKTVKNQLPKKAKSAKKALDKVAKSMKGTVSNAIKQDMNKAISVATTKLNALANKYQAKYNSIANARSNFISKMQDFGSLYEKVDAEAAKYDSYGFLTAAGKAGGIVFKDWSAATKELNTIKNNLQKLKSWGIDRSFLDEITNMDVASQLEYTNALIKSGAKEAQKQSKGYVQYMKTASSVGTNVYKSYVDQIDKAYQAELKTVMANLRKQMTSIGTNAAKGLVSGLSNKTVTKQLNKISKSFANTIVSTIKKKLGIKSPSKVMEGIGMFTGEGLVNGITDMRRKVASAANNLVAIPEMAMAGGYSGSLSNEYDYFAQAHYTIEVHTDLDGKEIARTIADPMQAELDRKQTRANRQLGKR